MDDSKQNNGQPEFDPNKFAATRRTTPSEARTIPPQGTPRPSAPPPLYPDPENFPLPERVDELDLAATRVSPVAAIPASRQPPPHKPGGLNGMGCFVRGFVIALFLAAGLVLLAAIGGVLVYAGIASTLPAVEDLRARSAQFETTRILDRNGNILYEILDPNAGRRTYVSIDRISPNMIAAITATEDKDFYNNPGFDVFAIARAFWQNLNSGETVSGASTITQQLARALLFSPEERSEQSYLRKMREAILAWEITRRYSKDEILELYLNEIYFGNLAYGIEAAAGTYFGTTAGNLTLSQASFLAGLPQSPGIYDIHSQREATLQRHRDVLVLMYSLSQERGCIEVSNSVIPVCVGVPEALAAQQEIENYAFPSPDVTIRYPHWVQFVREQLEARYDSQTIYRSGFTVYTSLDPGLQDTAQALVAQQVASLAAQSVTNGALVAIRPSTGEILAMVGSADFYNAGIDGQVNMATTQTRQPGSSIKPVTYLAAFEKGWTPATLIWDVPSYFTPSGLPNDPGELYVPVNYDERFHGPVTVRDALANSYNIPAVKALAFVGIYDDPSTPEAEGMIAMAEKLGITSLTRPDYGLSLTLGGGEVSLLELTGAYAVMAHNGQRIPPVAIMKIIDRTGNVVYEYQVPEGEQVLRPEHAYLISSILSDNNARAPMFGRNSLLNLPFQVAAKTGTTNDFRDNWTMGYTPDLAVGVWVGNADYTPMRNTTGLSGAAPIWSQFMQAAIQQLTGGNPSPFVRPEGIVDKVICSLSGAEPSRWCSQQRGELFAYDQLPAPASEDLWKEAVIDTWTGKLANNSCPDFVEEKLVMNVTEQFAVFWMRREAQGINFAESIGFDQPVFFVPKDECQNNDSEPTLRLFGPENGSTVTNPDAEIEVVAWATDSFQGYRLEYGEGSDPDTWTLLYESNNEARDRFKAYTWDLEDVNGQTVTLRLRMDNREGGYAERKLTFRVDIFIPTATPEPATATPTPTNTPPPTAIPPSETPTLTPTIEPSATPSP